jgi:hypothetical protein
VLSTALCQRVGEGVARIKRTVLRVRGKWVEVGLRRRGDGQRSKGVSDTVVLSHPGPHDNNYI